MNLVDFVADNHKLANFVRNGILHNAFGIGFQQPLGLVIIEILLWIVDCQLQRRPHIVFVFEFKIGQKQANEFFYFFHCMLSCLRVCPEINSE
ncbi:hypothetical protein D3C86_1794790 [compost metagenome]